MATHEVKLGEIIEYGGKSVEVIQPFTIHLTRDANTYLATHSILPGYELGKTRDEAIHDFLLFLVDEMNWLEIFEDTLPEETYKDLETIRKYIRWL